jgi:hypothetical protein
MTLQDLHELLETTGFPVALFEAAFDEDQDTLPYIVYAPTSASFDMASGTIWRKATRIGLDLFSQKVEDAEKLEAVLLRNKLFPTSVVTVWFPEHKIINTQFDLTISHEFDLYELEEYQ